jgi:DNA polymerase IV
MPPGASCGQARSGWVIHVDMDAFFASVEQQANPSLCGKPVIVGGLPGTRSTVATASYEARPFGVRSGMAIDEAARRCPQAVFLEGNAALYLHTARRIYAELGRFSPRVEPASIDEAYLEVETETPEALGAEIQAHLARTVELPASVGISESKFIAKVASSLCKPRGRTFLPRERLATLLWPLPVQVLPGVGAKTAAWLEAHGYRTVGDLAGTAEPVLERVLGGVGVSLCRRARGEDGGRVRPPEEAPDAKSIGHEHTLAVDCYDQSRLEALLCELAARVGRRARRHQMGGRRVVLKVRDRRFVSITHGRMVPEPVDADADLFAIACALLAETRCWSRGVRLVGLSLQQLVHLDQARQQVFEFAARPARALPALDQVQSKYGPAALVAARVLEAPRSRR